MSAIAESLRRQSVPLLTIAIVLVAGAIGWLVISRIATTTVSSDTDLPVAAPAVEQAPWKIKYAAEGRFGKLSTAQKNRFAVQKKDVGVLVASIYDALFLEPATLDHVIKSSFSSLAARSFDTKDLGLPRGATDAKTTTRRAVVSVDAQTADLAIARITVAVEATVNDQPVDVKHQSTLWLERDGDWKVIAFDLKQGPGK